MAGGVEWRGQAAPNGAQTSLLRKRTRGAVGDLHPQRGRHVGPQLPPPHGVQRHAHVVCGGGAQGRRLGAWRLGML